MDRKRTGLAVAAAGLLFLAAAHPPSADLRIELHNPADIAPHQVKAAVDIGLMAVSVLVTWSGKRVTR